MRTVSGVDFLEAHGAIEMIEKAYSAAEQVGRDVNEDLVVDSGLLTPCGWGGAGAGRRCRPASEGPERIRGGYARALNKLGVWERRLRESVLELLF